jgi:5'-nucleotidase
VNILVTNDDGINSPGIWALAEALTRVGSVLVVAPDKQQSGVGTSVSFTRDSVSITEVPSKIPDVQAYSVGGTPSDCVILGLKKLTRVHIDLVVSGINLGPNVGNDIPYSGTVMATLAGYFRRIPSVAISLAFKNPKEEMRFDAAGCVIESLARCIEKGAMLTEAILNVNVPNIPSELVKGIMVTRAAGFGYVRLGNSSGSGVVSYETKIGKPEKASLEEGTDIWAVNEGYVSITPLRFDVTHYDLLPAISQCVQGMDCKFGAH